MLTAQLAAPPRAVPDRANYTFIAVYSAVLYTVLLIAPIIAGKLTQQFGLTPTQVGLLFSLELGSFSLATVPAYLWLTRLDLRLATSVFTVVFLAGNLVSGLLDSFPLLAATRVVTSLAAGSITVILLTLSGKTANPSRAFGIFVVAQLAMGAVILAVFPAIYAGSDVAAVYWTLAGVAVMCLPVVRLIGGGMLRRDARAGASAQRGSTRIPFGKFAAGLVAVFLFYISLSGVWTFMAEISAKAAIDLSASSIVLSVATVAGIASALLATVLGDTPRRGHYLLGGYLAMATSVALLFGAPGLARFALAAVVFKFAWTFILPYLLSSLADLSSDGQVMNTTNLMIGSGFAIGPYLGGALIDTTGGFDLMLSVAAVGVLVSLACVITIHGIRTRQGDNP